jgi:hypothetical protein
MFTAWYLVKHRGNFAVFYGMVAWMAYGNRYFWCENSVETVYFRNEPGAYAA